MARECSAKPIFQEEAMMKRREFLKKAGAGAALGGIGGAALAQAPAQAQAQPVRWRQQSMWPKSLDTMQGSADAFARRVGQITEGRLEIRSHAAGELVPPPQVFDAVSNGTVEVGHVLSS